MVTTSIRHKHHQTTDNTKHHTQNSNWATTDTNTQHLHDTYTTHKGTPPTTRITDKTKITTPHPLHYTTTPRRKKQTTPRRKKQTTYNNIDYTTDIDTDHNTIDDTKIKTNMTHSHHHSQYIPQQPTTQQSH